MEGERDTSESSTHSGFVDLIIPNTSSHQSPTSKMNRRSSEPVKPTSISSKYSFKKQDNKSKKAVIIYPAPHADYEAVAALPLSPARQVSSRNNERASYGKTPVTKSLSSSKNHHSITRQNACDNRAEERRHMLEDWTDKELGNSKTQNAEMNYQSTANTSQGNEQDSLLPENHSSSTLADHIQINKPSQELPTSFRLLYHYRIKEALFILFLFLLAMAFTFLPHFMGGKQACQEGYFKCVLAKKNKYDADYQCCKKEATCCTDADGYGSCCSPGSACCAGACCSKVNKKCCGDICIPQEYDCCLAGVYCSEYYKCCIASSIVQCCQKNVLCNENTFCGNTPSKYR